MTWISGSHPEVNPGLIEIMGGKSTYIGNEALAKRGILTIRRPIALRTGTFRCE